MVSAEELKKKVNEITEVLTRLPEKAEVSYYNNSYNTYDKHEGDKSDKPVIGRKHSFNISVTFDEVFPKEEKTEEEHKKEEE